MGFFNCEKIFVSSENNPFYRFFELDSEIFPFKAMCLTYQNHFYTHYMINRRFLIVKKFR